MNSLQLGLLIWMAVAAVLVTGACLVVDTGKKYEAKRRRLADRVQNIQWPVGHGNS